jgi:tRNA A-37 threonylcarbamoyl transferase component Bud32
MIYQYRHNSQIYFIKGPISIIKNIYIPNQYWKKILLPLVISIHTFTKRGVSLSNNIVRLIEEANLGHYVIKINKESSLIYGVSSDKTKVVFKQNISKSVLYTELAGYKKYKEAGFCAPEIGLKSIGEMHFLQISYIEGNPLKRNICINEILNLLTVLSRKTMVVHNGIKKCLSHGDLACWNIVMRRSDETLVLLDWEFSNMRSIGYDIVFYFINHAVVFDRKISDETLKNSKYYYGQLHSALQLGEDEYMYQECLTSILSFYDENGRGNDKILLERCLAC